MALSEEDAVPEQGALLAWRGPARRAASRHHLVCAAPEPETFAGEACAGAGAWPVRRCVGALWRSMASAM